VEHENGNVGYVPVPRPLRAQEGVGAVPRGRRPCPWWERVVECTTTPKCQKGSTLGHNSRVVEHMVALTTKRGERCKWVLELRLYEEEDDDDEDLERRGGNMKGISVQTEGVRMPARGVKNIADIQNGVFQTIGEK
jgi:hypothetical protein